MAGTHSLLRVAACACVLLLGAHCAHAPTSYALKALHGEAADASGSVSVERVGGGQRIVVVQLSELPPPERIGAGLTEFDVWLLAPGGEQVRAGALHYDRRHQSGSLFATTTLAAFTVQITGERDPSALAPSSVLLAERKVTTN